MSSEQTGGAGADRGRPGTVQRADESGRSGGGRRSLLVGCLAIAVGGVMVIMLVAAALVLLMLASVVMAVTQGGAPAGAVPIQEVTVSGEPGQPKIAEIPVQGLLIGGGAPGQADSITLLRAMLDRAAQDDEVRAVLLRVNSGGGGVTACDRMHRRVVEFRRDSGLPVVVLMEDVAASGGYYISCAADRIIAHPTTVTGSIGVLMPIYNVNELMQKVGVTDRTIKSADFKDLASPTAEKSPEQWQQEGRILQGVIDAMHERFVSIVAEGRGLDPQTIRQLADGRIYTSDEALEAKLIDAVGYEDDALRQAMEAAGLEQAQVVRYQRVPSLMEMILAHAGVPELLGEGLLEAGIPPRPMYVWRPAAATQ